MTGQDVFAMFGATDSIKFDVRPILDESEGFAVTFFAQAGSNSVDLSEFGWGVDEPRGAVETQWRE